VIKSWSLHPDEKDSVLEALIRTEMKAEFPGGPTAWLNYLTTNLEYPSSLKGEHISGQVTLQFTVNIHGNIENITVLKSLNPVLDEEAIRVIQRSPKWKPAMQNHKKVPARLTQTINF
jgi:protein TonB